jgi:hypothetical protein
MVQTVRLGVALLASGLLVSCAARVTINDIKADPGRYQNRSVSVSGTVTTSVGAAILPVGLYQIEDGTGEISVLARRGTPSKGARVRVKGKVSSVAQLGNRSIGLHIQEEGRSTN